MFANRSFILPLLLTACIAAAPALAQKSKTSTRSKMTFQPGSKTPDDPSNKTSAPGNVTTQPSPAQDATQASPTPPPAKPSPSPATAPTATPQPELPAQALAPRLEAFFTLLASAEVDRAYDLLVRDSPISQKKQEVDDLKQKTREAMRLFGSIRGYEMTQISSVGKRIVRVTCVSLGESFPLRWRFYYYKPADAWRLIDIRVDDSLPDLFNERPDTGDKR